MTPSRTTPGTSRRVLCALVALLAGCGTRSALWSNPLDVVGPMAAGGRLVFVARQSSIAVVLDPTGAEATAFDLLPLPRDAEPTPTGIVVTGGWGNAPLVDVLALPAGPLRQLPVAGAYDHAAVSPDGHYAVLYYDPLATPAPGGPSARNNNEITVVDLFALTAQVLSLNTQSLAPESVVFSPDGRVAAVVMDGTMVMLLLDQPKVQVQVPLNLPDGTTLHPAKTLFAPDGQYLYMQAAGYDDLMALQVTVSAGSIGTAVNFLFYPGATGLVDIAVPAGGAFQRYIALLYSSGGTSTAALLDSTGDTTRTHFATFQAGATNFSDLGGGRLVLSDDTSVAVAAWEPLVDRSNLANLPAETSGLPLLTAGRAFFVHPAVTTSVGTSAALTGVSLDDNGSQLLIRENPIVLGGLPTSSAVDPVTGRFFLGVPVAREGSGAAPNLPSTTDFSGDTGSVVAIDPSTLAISGFALDASADGMGTVGQYVFVLHQSVLGDVTFFPTGSPTRASAHRVVGFMASHLMARAEGN